MVSNLGLSTRRRGRKQSLCIVFDSYFHGKPNDVSNAVVRKAHYKPNILKYAQNDLTWTITTTTTVISKLFEWFIKKTHQISQTSFIGNRRRENMIGGGRVYWGKKADREMDDGGSNGVVVIFAWSSINESHLASFVDLYSSLGWNSLVCRADFLTA